MAWSRGSGRASKAAGAAGGPTGGATLDACLAEAAAEKPRPVYLFDGDAFLALRAARAVAHALVPEASRALNLVELDAAASPAEVAAELATGGLFGGGKVVLVQEPAFLASKEDADEAFARARDAWAKGAQRDGARRLLALAARAGWSLDDLAPGAAGGIDHDALAKDLGVSSGVYDGALVEA